MTAAKLASNAVETAKIKDKAVTTAKLADSAVTATQLANDAVTVAKILAGTITFDRLASAAIATQEQAIAGTANDVLMTPQRVAQAIDELLPPSIPTGALMFFHATTPPEGWLLCNGQGVSRTTYANLFAVIGTKYGAGDGSTTFNLPNLHHRFLEGTTTTSEVGSSVQAGLPNITGSFTVYTAFNSKNPDFKNEASGAFTVGDGGGNGESNRHTDTCPKWTLSAIRSSGVYGNASTVQPNSVRIFPCIKS